MFFYQRIHISQYFPILNEKMQARQDETTNSCKFMTVLGELEMAVVFNWDTFESSAM